MDKQTKELQKLIIAIIAWSMIVILILYKRKKTQYNTERY